jgi:hypothetical protein
MASNTVTITGWPAFQPESQLRLLCEAALNAMPAGSHPDATSVNEITIGAPPAGSSPDRPWGVTTTATVNCFSVGDANQIVSFVNSLPNSALTASN